MTTAIDQRNKVCAPWTAERSPFAVYGTDTEEDWHIKGTWYDDDGSASAVLIGTVYGTDGHLARLAAAAPALLDALKATIQALEYWLPRYGDPEGANSLMMQQARAAIAQAEGDA